MKIARGIGQIFLLFFEIIVIALFLVAFFIRTSNFQTYLAQKATVYLTEKLGSKVDIEKIDIIFFDRLDIEGVFLEDKYKDTLLSAEQISVNIGDWDLKQKYLIVDNVVLKNADAQLSKSKGDSTFNFQHIIDFIGTSENDTSSAVFDVQVRQMVLENVNFKYNDYNVEPIVFGVDYSHLAIQNLNGSFSNFNFKDKTIQTKIENLSFKEKSGLIVKNFSSEVLYNSNLISLESLHLSLFESELNANIFELTTNNGNEDFNDFVNKVPFNAHLVNTKIALADLSYFIPQLNGMTDTLTIVNAEVSGPVNGMRLRNVDVRTLTKTQLKGNFQIPDITEINSAFIDQNIALFQTSVNDIEAINLKPFLNGDEYIKIPKNLKGLSTVKLVNGHFTGTLASFVVDGNIYSGLGNLYSENGLKFEKKKDGLYHYQGGQSETAISKDLRVEQLKLGLLTGNRNLGVVNGYLQILEGSKGFSAKDIDLLFKGHFDDIVVNGYDYKNVIVRNGQYHNDRFIGKIDIEDDNLALVYDGYIDFKNILEFNFDVKIDSSYLVKLKLMDGDLATNLKTKVHVNLRGSTLENIVGEVDITRLEFFNGKKKIEFDEVNLSINRSEQSDTIRINSGYVDAELNGKFDFSQMIPMLNNQLANLIPNYVKTVVIPEGTIQDFKLSMNLKDINPILRFYDTAYYVQPYTKIELESHLANQTTMFNIQSDRFEYQNRVFSGIQLNHTIDSMIGNLNYQIASVQLNDSLEVDNFRFNSVAQNNNLATDFGWKENSRVKSAQFKMNTELLPANDIYTQFESSYFYLQDSRWEVLEKSSFLWNPDHIAVNELTIKNDNHYVKLDGQVSQNPNDWLNIDVKDFDLSELNGFLGGDLTLNGILNMKGGAADLYNEIRAKSDANIKDLAINSELVGDVTLVGNWDIVNNALDLTGNLMRDNVKRFDFKGFYYVDRKKDNLDLDLVFDHTNIAFLNAFSDPELYTNIRGNLDGSLKVKGELDNPIIIGDLMVEPTSVHVPMFNVDYMISGLLNFNKGEILADYLEITDQLGNKGVGMMQIYHKKYSKWNYDVTLDFEDPNITKTFLAMDTEYNEGDIYYGKAFVTGNVNIFGYNDITEITVDIKTEKGTNLTLPLYGTSEIEESSFVKFYNPDTLSKDTNTVRIDRLGMTLNMNFRVTDEAKVNIVFDPLLNDEIEARGSGDIEMTMDDYGDIAMFGKYTIHNGMYHFNMKNVVKEDFEIIDGSTVVWTQSPYDANIDIKTRFKRNVDMSDILSADLGKSGSKDLVYGYLNLSNTLMNPSLKFDTFPWPVSQR